jgi:phage-related minor tail protein
MWSRFIERRPIQKGLKRAGVHLAKAAYEVAGGVGAFIDEIVSAVRDGEDDPVPDGPTRITIE